MINRRQLLQAASLAMLAACAPAKTVAPVYPRIYSRKPWAAPRVSQNAVIRVIVGHRPYRYTGFRVEREEINGKRLIHNYGHGGGGLSLGWGSSALAVRETGGLTPGNAAQLRPGA